VPTDGEIRQWIERLQAALGGPGCPSPVTGGLARRASLAEYAVASVCWRERAASLASEEPDPLFGVRDADDLEGEGERQAVALLVREGLLSAPAGGTLMPNGTVTRAEALELLAGLAETAGAPEWRHGEFASLAEGQLTVLRGEEADHIALDPAVRLFRSLEGVHTGTSELTLAVGDRVDYVSRGGRVVYLEAHQTPATWAPGRSSRYSRWEAALTPGDVARKVARYGSVGEVRDLVPRRLGVSGRVVELEVQGTAGDLLLKGLKVRWGLGLRENLFVIDRERDPEGQVERFVISGKGWGHGVGLCQVGAFGMAQAGSTFEGILGHYYTGVHLAQATEIDVP
jgi:stage II sporulation protein D